MLSDSTSQIQSGRRVIRAVVDPGHPLASPTGEVGDHDLVVEVELGLVQDQPAAGAAAPRLNGSWLLAESAESPRRGAWPGAG